jgi:hypothetical protein
LRHFVVRSLQPEWANHPGALRASQVVLPVVDAAVSAPDVPCLRPYGPFLVVRQAFSLQKNALTVQHASMRDYHFALNGQSVGLE